MKLLLAWCAPWLVALPLASVRRIAAYEVAPQGGSGDAWLGRVAGLAVDIWLPAWDVGGLLGHPLALGESSSWIIIDQPLSAALRVGRCLQVVDVGDFSSIPYIPPIIGGASGTRCFATAGMKTGLDPQPDFGLLLAPEYLLAAAASAATQPEHAT